MSAFLDTNVLLYADDADGGAKTEIARNLVRQCVAERSGVVSTQILQEYYVNARKKLKLGGAAARARVDIYAALDVVTITTELVLAAIDRHQRDTVSFWDALVVTAAERAACEVLWSEDLQDGRRFGDVVVRNPFA